MAQKSILIIGAGVAGLCAGIYGQMNGYRTRIVEQHKIPGGLATAYRRKGYLIDLCVHGCPAPGRGSSCTATGRRSACSKGGSFCSTTVMALITPKTADSEFLPGLTLQLWSDLAGHLGRC